MQQGLSIYCVLLISSWRGFPKGPKVSSRKVERLFREGADCQGDNVEGLFWEGAGVIPKGAGVRWMRLSESGFSRRASAILERP